MKTSSAGSLCHRQRKYFTDHSPLTGAAAEIARSTAEDIEKRSTRRTPSNIRGNTRPPSARHLLKIADKWRKSGVLADRNAGQWQPIRETRRGRSLSIDHFRYFAAASAPKRRSG